MTAARPSAVPVAPASEVPNQTSTTGTSTQLKAAQPMTSLTVSAAGRGSLLGRAPGISYSLWRWLTPIQRTSDRSVTTGASVNAVQTACTGQQPLRYGRGSCMLR
ncbi:hypothetical protein GCM10009787_21690 [Streptomyces bangladeshensis]|uniref:Uncharacterized protein n=1 Tax=Streptomyces bangladeshensis TaxID=295352 RepID=A0ABN3BFV0_9ACTN